MIIPCSCGSTEAEWFTGVDHHQRPTNLRIYACPSCFLRRAGCTERHPNVFVSGGLARRNQRKRNPPYRDFRKDDGRITFSRYWRNLWLRGYDAMDVAMDSDRLGGEWHKEESSS